METNHHILSGHPGEHVISPEVLGQAEAELSRGNAWVAYNSIPYFLERGGIWFFKHQDEAGEFSANNISEYDNYIVIHARSVADMTEQITYASPLDASIQTNDINSSLLKNETMNENNLEYLKKNLMYAGFDDKLNIDLESSIREGKPEFQLQYGAEFNNRKMDMTLHFKKGDQNEMYFFNRFDATLGDRQQMFYMNKGNSMTVKEAFNLLEGRAVNKDLVNKEGQKYNAWVQLDFGAREESGNYKMERYHEKYGYDLEKALSAYPVRELNDQKTKENLIQSLEKGNLQAVHVPTNGKEQMFFISANPKDRTVDIFDKQMKPVQHETLMSAQPGKKQEQKKELAADDLDDGSLKKKRTRKKGMTL